MDDEEVAGVGRDRIEFVEPGAGPDGVGWNAEVVRRRPRMRRWWLVVAAGACGAAMFGWVLVGADDDGAETAGFVVADAAAFGYELVAAFDDTDEVVVDGGAGPLVRAFGPVQSEDPWSEAFLLQRSRTPREALLRGEVVDAGGVEAFIDETGASKRIRWEHEGQVLTVASARLDREQLIDAAGTVAGSEDDGRVPGYELLHEGPFHEFATRSVLTYGDIPGAAGVVYDRPDVSSSAVVVTWGPAGRAGLWAPTVTTPSVAHITIDDHEAVVMDAGRFDRLMTVSWIHGGQLVQLAASGDFPEGIDGLVELASRVEPVGAEEAAALLRAHRGSVQLHIRRSARDPGGGSAGVQIERLRSEIGSGVTATVTVQERRSGAYLLQLVTDLGARRTGLGLEKLDVATVVGVDVPMAGVPGRWVLAGLAPPGTTELTVIDVARGDPVDLRGRFHAIELPGTDHLLFMQAISTTAGHDRFAVILHHDGKRTEFRV